MASKVIKIKYCEGCEVKPCRFGNDLCLHCWGKPIKDLFKLAGLYKEPPKRKEPCGLFGIHPMDEEEDSGLAEFRLIDETSIEDAGMVSRFLLHKR